MTTDIEKLAQQMREAAAHMLKASRPCDCDRCYCGKPEDAAYVAAWDADKASSTHILALLDDRDRLREALAAKEQECDRLREALLEARTALSVAKDALDQCYDVTEWPADGSSDQDAARAYCASVLSRAEAALATSGGGNG